MTARKALLLVGGLVLASAVHAAPVTIGISTDFSVTGQSLFGSGGSAGFGGSVGIGNNSSTFQFTASTGASTGSIDSSAGIGLQLSFDNQQTLGSTTSFSLGFDSASVEFSTDLGAFLDVTATVRTPVIPVPVLPDIPAASIPFNLVDEDYQLDVADSDSTYFFGQTLSDSDSVELPGAGVGFGATVSANPNVDQTSSLTLSELAGTLTATNQTSGAIVTSDFNFSGGSTILDLTLTDTGIWDLALTDLILDNVFSSVFGLSATFTGGVAVGINCGNPATDSDNEFGCLFDAGVSTTTPTVDLLDVSAFSLNYNTISSLFAGQVVVSDVQDDPPSDDPSQVPTPGTLVLMMGALASIAAFRRRSIAHARLR